MTRSFRAMITDKVDGKPQSQFRNITLAELPDENVLVDVAYSSLNYKDGLAISGAAPICRKTPMVCGIDLAGVVVESASNRFKPGDQVLANGWGLSEIHWGGYSQKQRLRADWLLPVPEVFSLQDTMAIGTAGYTAMLCVLALENGKVLPGSGDVLVTGAAGGVGSIAVLLLSKLGYPVVASTGRAETTDYLKSLGAGEVIDRKELAEQCRPLGKERWAGAVDSVGSQTLASILSQINYGGTVAACGLAGGSDLPTTVLPFILRNVRLEGIDSVMATLEKRQLAWARLAADLDKQMLAAVTTVEPMSKLPELAESIVKGQTRGRVVIDVNA